MMFEKEMPATAFHEWREAEGFIYSVAYEAPIIMKTANLVVRRRSDCYVDHNPVRVIEVLGTIRDFEPVRCGATGQLTLRVGVTLNNTNSGRRKLLELAARYVDDDAERIEVLTYD